jgi:hypothetical protein
MMRTVPVLTAKCNFQVIEKGPTSTNMNKHQWTVVGSAPKTARFDKLPRPYRTQHHDRSTGFPKHRSGNVKVAPFWRRVMVKKVFL